jgi:glycosyltransferase involved in cell wall biosynthesis
MRIAIYHNLPSGGGKRALQEMTRRLAERHQIDIYTLTCAEQDFCDLRPFAKRHVVAPFSPLPFVRRPFGRLNQGIRTLNLLRLHRSQQHVAQQIDAGHYDVVFAHNCQFMQSPSVLVYLRTRSAYYCAEPPRFIYEPRIPRPYAAFSTAQRAGNLFDPLPRIYRSVLARLDRQNVRAATRVLANSAFSHESLYRTYGIFADVCYLGVDVDRFRHLSLPKEDFVLTVGSLNPNKGFDFVIRSLALLDATRRLPLMIVSNSTDERERHYLQTLARQLDVQVTFRANVTDDELVQLYNRASLTVYSPVMEPFGFVPLESMACGTPVIGVKEGGVRESVIDDVTGKLVERDTSAMADAISSLVSDPVQAERLSRNGRAVAEEKWTWSKSVETLEQYLTRTASSRI